VGVGGRVDQAIELLQEATKVFKGRELCTLLHTLAVFHLNQGQAQMARVQLQFVLAQEPMRATSWLHLAYADLLLNDLAKASESMRSFAACGQSSTSPAEQVLIDFLKPRVPI
jgi:predicted Zn-dependent protease